MLAALTHSFSVLDTVGQTTKSVPVVGGVTDPLLKTVGGVTDGLPIVSELQTDSQGAENSMLTLDTQVGGNGQPSEEEIALAKKKRALALRKKQLALEEEEMAMEG
jgi:hypothetical protein